MQKNIAESKRSIHSTRIDVIAGDLTPIVPKSVLPINFIDRPVVEDPEYLPDTVPDLAAAMSALARAVPAEKVGEIYRTIRDIIDRIAPVTRTSLEYVDLLREGLTVDDDPEDPLTGVKNTAASIALSIQAKIRHYRSIGTAFADQKADELQKFARTVRDAFDLLSRLDTRARQNRPGTSERDRDVLARFRAGAFKKFSDLASQYNKVIRDEQTAFESKTEAPSSTTLSLIQAELPMSEENRLDIFNAFEARIRELRAAGDSFDASVADAVRNRSKTVYPMIGIKTIGDQSLDKASSKVSYELDAGNFQFSKALYQEITKDTSDLSHFRVELTRSLKKGRAPEIQDIHIDSYFSPGRIRAEIVPEGESVRYDPESSDEFPKHDLEYVTSFGYVHAYRRFLQMFDGSEVEIRPDVRIDFEKIKLDFIDDAAEDLRRQGVSSPEEAAESFYEKNRKFIVREAINPQKGVGKFRWEDEESEFVTGTRKRRRKPKVRDEKGRIRTFTRVKTPERAALIVANQRLEDLEKATRAGSKSVEEELSRRAQDAAAKLVASGVSYDEIISTLSSDFSEIKADEIRRILATATRSRRNKATLAVNEVQDLRKTVKTYFKQTTFIAGETAPVPSGEAAHAYLHLQEKAKESFKIVSDGDVEKMRERGIKAAQKIEQAMPPESATQAIGEVLSRAVNSADKAVKLADTAFMSNLVAVLRHSLGDIAASQRKSVSDAVNTVQIDNPEFAFSSEFQKILVKKAAINDHMTKLANDVKGFGTGQTTTTATTTTVSPGVAIRRTARPSGRDLGTLTGIAKEIAAIARMSVDISPPVVKFNEMINGTLEDQLSDVIVDAIDEFMSNEKDAASYALLSRSGEVDVSAMVGRIGADLASLPAANSKADNALEALIGEAMRRYGLTTRPFFMPVFAEGDLANKIVAVADRSKRKIVSYSSADVLLGSVGLSERIAESVESLSPDRALPVLNATIDSMARVALRGEIASFDSDASLAKIIRSIVNISCRALIISASAGDTKQAEFTHINDYLDALSDMIQIGVRSPEIVLAPITKGLRSIQRAVSVDMRERGVGFYVDTVGRSIARVVASPNVHNLTQTTIEFLDPVLADAFDRFEDTASKIIASKVNASFDSESFRVIQAQVRAELIVALQDASAEINFGIVTSQSFSAPQSQMPMATFRDLQEKIIKSGTSSRFAKSVATAAYNYTVINKRVPGEFIPYFAPVRVQERINPDTGMPTLKRGASFDFLFKTLPLAAADPRIDDAPPHLDESFLAKVYKIVDMHVLSDISDGLGETVKKLYDANEKQKDALAKILTMTPAVSTGSRVARFPKRLKEGQILTVYDVIRPGMEYDEFVKIQDEAQTLAIKMLVAANGYTVLDRDGKKPGFISVKLNPTQHLAPLGLEILEAVKDHVDLSARNAGVEYYTQKVKGVDGEEKVVAMSSSDMASLAEKRARAALIQKIGEEHPSAIGLTSPVSIRSDQLTGHPALPPTPNEYIRKHMPEYGGITSITDPVGYLLRLTRTVKEYRDLLESYGTASKKKQLLPSLTSVLETLIEKHSTVVERARELSRKRMEGKTPPQIDPVPMISYKMQTGAILGVSNPPLSSETRVLFDQLVLHYEKFKDEAAKSSFLSAHEADLSTFRERFRLLQKVQDLFEATQNYTKAFAELYIQCATILNRVIASIVDAETKKLENEVTSIYLPDIKAACEEGMKKDSDQKTSDDLSDIILKIDRILGIDEETIKQRREKKVSFKIPTIENLSSQALGDLAQEHKLLVANLRRVRKKAGVVADRAIEQTDKQLSDHARKMLRAVADATQVDVNMKNFYVVNTIEDLSTLKEQMLNERKQSLIEKLPEKALLDMSEDSLSRIDAAAQSYVKTALSHMIFGVRNVSNT